MKIMVIDGNSIINRAYHGIRPLSNHEGTPTNAVYGFLSTLFKQQDEERPDRTVVCFDVKEKTFRHLKFDTYKATRKPMDEELAVQMPIVKEVLDALGIVRCELAGYEADDLLGTISRRANENGDECVILTGDRDSLQLVGGGQGGPALDPCEDHRHIGQHDPHVLGRKGKLLFRRDAAQCGELGRVFDVDAGHIRADVFGGVLPPALK